VALTGLIGRNRREPIQRRGQVVAVHAGGPSYARESMERACLHARPQCPVTRLIARSIFAAVRLLAFVGAAGPTICHTGLLITDILVQQRPTSHATRVVQNGQLRLEKREVTQPDTQRCSSTAASHLTSFLISVSDLSPPKRNPWPESVSELYLPSHHHLSAKLVPNFVDVTDPLRP
jgi:hypothetical protein